MSDFRTIPLTRGLEAIVDAADYEALSAFKWHVSVYGYACRSASRSGSTLMHRVLTGATRGSSVDHVNGDKLDNRRVNLRICTHAQNLRNRGVGKNNVTGFKGVYVRSDTGRFRAMIGAEGVHHSLGCFKTAEDAARAYDVAARRLHGAFARLNFPEAA